MGRSLSAVLRLLGAGLMLLALLVPRAEAEAAAPSAEYLPYGQGVHGEGGACGESQQEELVDCGASLHEMLDEPLAIALLRALDVRMTEKACNDLLADIWAQQSCQAEGRDCGKMNSAAPAPPAPKLASSSSSARSSWATIGLAGDDARSPGFNTQLRGPSSRDLQPPVPPPRLLGH
ncbi:hypothetical protein [Enhygromyxa salina]|uniref:hypothetical protein n=1 Tax=Enhygromyxa salina TaxID=215803 RepID=UPI000D093286|nr:hypothetical protein [Enhygromyxa salina]